MTRGASCLLLCGFVAAVGVACGPPPVAPAVGQPIASTSTLLPPARTPPLVDLRALRAPCDGIEDRKTVVVAATIPPALCDGLGVLGGVRGRRVPDGIEVRVASVWGGLLLGVDASPPQVCEVGVMQDGMAWVEDMTFPRTRKKSTTPPAVAEICTTKPLPPRTTAPRPRPGTSHHDIAPSALPQLTCDDLKMHDVTELVNWDGRSLSGTVAVGCRGRSPDPTYIVVEPTPGALRLCTLQGGACVDSWVDVGWPPL